MLNGTDSQGEIYIIKINKLDRDGDHGIWSPATIAKEFIPVELDITDLITKAGTYDVTFQYTQGRHRLDIQSAALIQDGQQVSIDQHEGFSGGSKRGNIYRIKLEEYQRNSTYTLKAYIKGGGGIDSHGKISITPRP